MNASNSLTQSRPLYTRNGLIALLFQPFLGEMLFLPSDLLFKAIFDFYSYIQAVI